MFSFSESRFPLLSLTNKSREQDFTTYKLQLFSSKSIWITQTTSVLTFTINMLSSVVSLFCYNELHFIWNFPFKLLLIARRTVYPRRNLFTCWWRLKLKTFVLILLSYMNRVMLLWSFRKKLSLICFRSWNFFVYFCHLTARGIDPYDCFSGSTKITTPKIPIWGRDFFTTNVQEFNSYSQHALNKRKV